MGEACETKREGPGEEAITTVFLGIVALQAKANTITFLAIG